MILTVNTGLSQISIGIQPSVLSLVGITSNHFGFGFNVGYGLSEKTTTYGGFNYYTPSVSSKQVWANAVSNTVIPSQIRVELQERVSFFQFYFGGKRYLAGDAESAFNLYGLGEAGLFIAPYSSSTPAGSFNDTLYRAPISSEETLYGLTVNFGLGVEVRIAKVFLYSDFKINLIASEANGNAVSSELPNSLSGNLGLRVPLGGLSDKRHKLKLR